MSIDSRLSKLMPALSARERAALIVRAFKDDEPEDPDWRRTMPADQADELGRLIGLENAVASPLSSLIASLKKEVEKMTLKVTLIEECTSSAKSGLFGLISNGDFGRWLAPLPPDSTAFLAAWFSA